MNGTFRDDHSFNRSSDREVTLNVAACALTDSSHCALISKHQVPNGLFSLIFVWEGMSFRSCTEFVIHIVLSEGGEKSFRLSGRHSEHHFYSDKL